MKRKVYQRIATLHCAILNCIEFDNLEWEYKHREELIRILNNHLPSESGIDGWIDNIDLHLNGSKADRLVFFSGYHKMNENGMSDGWIDFDIIVKPSLQFGIEIDVRGKFGKDQDIKEYIHEMFNSALNEEIEIAMEEV
tara:strand:+ start:104 stop:520 length:417 start_codon:yes stop_codon:yes gene_type:complete